MTPLRLFDRWVLKHAPPHAPDPETTNIEADVGLSDQEKAMLYARLKDVEDTLRLYEAKARLRRRDQREPGAG